MTPKLVILALVFGVVMLMGSAKAYTNITGCTDIITQGEYFLNTSITNTDDASCITINASNVLLDCGNRTIDGDCDDELTNAIMASYPAGYQLSNITIRNCKVTEFNRGITFNNVSNSYVYNFESSLNCWTNNYGIVLTKSYNNVFEDVRVFNFSGGGGGISLSDCEYCILNRFTSAWGRYGDCAISAGNHTEIMNGLIYQFKRGICESYSRGNATFHNITVRDGSADAITVITLGEGAGHGYPFLFYNCYLNASKYNGAGINLIHTSSGSYRQEANMSVEKYPGTNVIGGPYIGGNYYATGNGGGYSATCINYDGDGICDSPYNLSTVNLYAIDYYPLTYFTTPSPIIVTFVSPTAANGTEATNKDYAVWNMTIQINASSGLFAINGTNQTATCINYTSTSSCYYNETVSFANQTRCSYGWASNSSGYYNRTVNYICRDFVFINETLDNTINISYPANGSLITSLSVDFTYIPFVKAGPVTNCSLWTNESGNWSSKEVNSTAVIDNGTNTITETFLNNTGSYTWMIECYIGGLPAYSDNWTFDINYTPPLPSDLTPTWILGDGLAADSRSTCADSQWLQVDSFIRECAGPEGAYIPNCYWLNTSRLYYCANGCFDDITLNGAGCGAPSYGLYIIAAIVIIIVFVVVNWLVRK